MPQNNLPPPGPQTQAEHAQYYETHRPGTGLTPVMDAAFALQKLTRPPYTNSDYRLSESQVEQLRAVANNQKVEIGGVVRERWDAYCHILTCRQIMVVGW